MELLHLSIIDNVSIAEKISQNFFRFEVNLKKNPYRGDGSNDLFSKRILYYTDSDDILIFMTCFTFINIVTELLHQ